MVSLIGVITGYSDATPPRREQGRNAGIADYSPTKSSRDLLLSFGVNIAMDYALQKVSFALCVLLTCAGCRHGRTTAFSHINGPSVLCSSTSAFFPSSIGGSAPLSFGADQAEWEAMYLQHMHEPSLYQCPSPGDEPSFRFLWDRSLSYPIEARLVVHQNGTGTLFVRTLAHATLPPPPIRGERAVSSDEWYRQILDRQISITRPQVDRVEQMVQSILFATGHSVQLTDDGSDWIFEIEQEKHYQVVDFRNHPPEAAKTLGLFIVVNLGQVNLQSGEIY